MVYWHDYELRLPLREVATRYPKTYQKVGNQLRDMGLTSEGLSREDSKQIVLKQWIATLAAMPPHVQPYKKMGCTKTWAQQDWTSVFEALAE
tara:strand:- start:14 stop:289 length:276 start_codon:yes stop_codon:yes gene_type:complete